MKLFRKINTAIQLQKNLAEIPGISTKLKNIVTPEDIQKLINFIDFKLTEDVKHKAVEATALHAGASVRRILGHDGLRISVMTDKPIAIDSLDHLHPWGTKQDNSKNFRFNNKLFEWLPIEYLQVLDIGCSGGGFVKTIHDAGGLAVGIEGSDYSKLRARAEWRTIPHRLFTADVTVPFEVIAKRNGNCQKIKFSLITAWEFIEHIEEPKLSGVFKNIENHLDKDGVVIMSVSPNDDIVNGVNLHRTVKPFDWWIEKTASFGFKHHSSAVAYFSPDNWIRYEENAPNSFHLVLTRQSESMPALPSIIRG